MSILKNFINGKNNSCLPIWFMRQAGRYLPEFRKIRSENKNFIKLCLNSNLSSEITLQPIKRFNLDAAIIFSDILMIPFGLAQDVEFKKNHGPVLSNFDLKNFSKVTTQEFLEKLKPVYNAIRQTRTKLDKEKSLIGFAGAPWTLLVYMLGLKTHDNKLDINIFKKEKENINLILDRLTDFIKIHIENQINAGAEVIQIFDSWASLIPNENMNDYCYNPNLALVEFCKKKSVPVISFPKGIQEKYEDFVKIVKPNVINIDYALDPIWVKNNLKGICIQGGMDPKTLLKDENDIMKEATKYLKIFKGQQYIFNLGHGLLPGTNPDKVDMLIKFIRKDK